MDDFKSMNAAGWVAVAAALVLTLAGNNDGWVMFNLAAAHAWFISANIVRSIDRGRVVIHNYAAETNDD